MTNEISQISRAQIGRSILSIRGRQVMLDSDLARFFEVETKVFNQAVRRNIDRFPEDFMFQLTEKEFSALKLVSQDRGGWGGRRYLPFVFTEQGVAMLASVLNSPRAIEINIMIIRTFVEMRRMIAGNEKLARKLQELERSYDAKFKVVFDAIRKLMQPGVRPRRKIGFRSEDSE